MWNPLIGFEHDKFDLPSLGLRYFHNKYETPIQFASQMRKLPVGHRATVQNE